MEGDFRHGDAAELVPLVYGELRRMAAAFLRRERPGQTLQPTALVHEAYMRLAGGGRPWLDRSHFLAIAARSMRQILVDRSRARGALKRWAAGGARPHRARAMTLSVDAAIGAALVVDGLLVASTRPVAGVLVMALGVGLALARVVIEPATAEAAFSDGGGP